MVAQATPCSGNPIPRAKMTEAMMRFFVSERSTFASIRVRKPVVPIIPKRRIVTPPITGYGHDRGLQGVKHTKDDREDRGNPDVEGAINLCNSKHANVFAVGGYRRASEEASGDGG